MDRFPRYKHLNDLKINSILKTLLAISGWNLAYAPFTEMMATGESRQDFTDHSVQQRIPSQQFVFSPFKKYYGLS